MKMASSDSLILRQLSSKEDIMRKSTSKRWGVGASSLKQMEVGGSFNSTTNYMVGGNNGTGGGMFVMEKKRVMVVVDHSSHSKHAMMWALTHVANNGDILTLLHVLPAACSSDSSSSTAASPYLAATLGSLCKACKPEVEVEILVIQGPKMATVMSQAKKLEVSVLVLGQKNPSLLLNCLCVSSRTEEFVEQCIDTLDCLTIGVRKQSNGLGGYLISTRWHKNFWLLA